MVAHYKVESRHHPQPLGRPRTRVTYPLRDRHSPGENKPGVKVGQGAGTLTLRHAIPPPRASKLSFWMENIILHFVYCVPKLHIHHAATQEGWTSVSATSATVFRTWVWQILSPQAGSWWGLGLSPTLRFIEGALLLDWHC